MQAETLKQLTPIVRKSGKRYKNGDFDSFSLEKLILIVNDVFDVDLLKSTSTTNNMADAKAVYHKISYIYVNSDLTTIASKIGDDHSLLWHYKNKCDKLRTVYPKYEAKYQRCLEMFAIDSYELFLQYMIEKSKKSLEKYTDLLQKTKKHEN